jgi:hypothetical protein
MEGFAIRPRLQLEAGNIYIVGFSVLWRRFIETKE